jgi:FAD/FMN-containing dehydrogenase
MPSDDRDASTLLARLSRELPADVVTTDPSDLAEYGRDWTKVVAPSPCAVAFPRSTEEVSRIVRLCGESGVAIVPSGGRTGLAGGAVASRGELVLSLGRMRAMGPVDELGATVRVEAGAVTEAVHRHVEPFGLTWPVDFASKGSSTIGGNIATNAGGVKVIRYGLTRQWVLGLEVVLPSGEIIAPGGALEKNNSGLDLRQLFIGSEGTLGVITAATLKLTRKPASLDVMLFATAGLAAVLALFREARRGPFAISAYEFFTEACLTRLRRHRTVAAPFGEAHSHYVLIEVEAGDRAALEAWIANLFEAHFVEDGVMAQHAREAAELWTLREGISESLSATGFPHKNDIAIPVAALEGFTGELEALFARRYPGWEICLFGHIGDGNLHVNVMKPDGMAKEAFLEKTHEVDRAIFELVGAHQGSISAEHGIGLLKKPYLGFTRSEAELEVMRAVKRALDPMNRMNPGKILDGSP